MGNDSRVDLNGPSQHLKHLTKAKIDVTLLMGGVGKFASFAFKERLLLVREARAMSSLKIVANVSSACQNNVLLMAQKAHRSGYDVMTILSPYYYGQAVKQLLSYLRQLGQTLSSKWFAYSLLARTGYDLTPELVVTLAAKLRNPAGIRDTVDCQSHIRGMIQTTRAVREDLTVLSGYDKYYTPDLLASGVGITSGLNSVTSGLSISAREAFKQDDLATPRDIQDQIGIYMSIYAVDEDFATTIRIVVSRKFGYCASVSRNAGGELDESECRTTDEMFVVKE